MECDGLDRVISSKQPSPFLKRLLEIKRLRQENPMIINCVLLSLGSYIFQSSISWSHSFKRVIIGKALWEEINPVCHLDSRAIGHTVFYWELH